MSGGHTASCPDCGHETDGAFCPDCGQRVDVDPRSVRYWVRTFLDETLSIEGRLPRTLKALVLQPGRLTREWLDGRRSRWSQPFRVYLLLSVVFFAVALVSPTEFVTSMVAGPGMAAEQAKIDSGKETAWQMAPQLVIVLVPLFALLLKYVFDRRRYYVDHLIHAFHIHAFSFLILSTSFLLGFLPYPWGLYAIALGLLILPYALLSSRRVYGKGLLVTSLGTLLVLFLHVWALTAAFAGVATVTQRDPRDERDRVHERYWEVRDALAAGEEEALFGAKRVILRYERLEAHLYNAHVRADLADLLLRVGRSEEARARIDEALLSDPDHLLALGIAARTADTDSTPAAAWNFRGRFLTAYATRADDDEFRGQHRADLELFKTEAESTEIVPNPVDTARSS